MTSSAPGTPSPPGPPGTPGPPSALGTPARPGDPRDLGGPGRRGGAVTARPPGAVAAALAGFWADRRLPVPARTLAVTGGVGLVGGVLVAGHEPGLGLAVVGALLWVAALPTLARRRSTGDLVTVALCVALVGVAAVRDADWVVLLCLAAAGWAAAVTVTAARSGPAVLLATAAAAAAGLRSVRWLAGGLGALAGTRRAQVLAVARSGAVTVALLLVFGLLFAGADRVFASLLPSVDAGLLPAQVVVGALVALATATAAHLVLAPPRWSAVVLPPAVPVRRAEWLLPVGALAALVLAFVLVQVGALVGGHRYVLRTAGLGYAEYARQGFGQLLVATALTLLVVAVAARCAPRATAADRGVSRAALGALCLGTLGVVASALRRMDLYVEAFGLTPLRILAVTAEVVLGAVLVLVLVAGIRWHGAWLPRAAVRTAAVAALGLAVLNPDAQIVRHNVAATLDLDVLTVQRLSADAVVAIAGLDEPLRSCLLDGVAVAPPDSLAGWNLGRDRAARVLAGDGTASSSLRRASPACAPAG